MQIILLTSSVDGSPSCSHQITILTLPPPPQYPYILGKSSTSSQRVSPSLHIIMWLHRQLNSWSISLEDNDSIWFLHNYKKVCSLRRCCKILQCQCSFLSVRCSEKVIHNRWEQFPHSASPDKPTEKDPKCPHDSYAALGLMPSRGRLIVDNVWDPLLRNGGRCVKREVCQWSTIVGKRCKTAEVVI